MWPLVDHHDGDGLNNQGYNLRPATHFQNCQNSRGKHGIYSLFKGIRQRRGGQWTARIRVYKKELSLGCFHDEIEAAKAYDLAAKKYFGEFARLNFP
jgi:hypothetical protein